MAAIQTKVLRAYLLGGRLPIRGCVREQHRICLARRDYHATSKLPDDRPPRFMAKTEEPPGLSPSDGTSFRKQLKDKIKAARIDKAVLKRLNSEGVGPQKSTQTVHGWETTIGIEIHAQLNTKHKLFSSAISPSPTSISPNTTIEPFDLAVPGTLPVFQPQTLIPAVRAALALGCEIQEESRFDRKHYFHWDQPSGYQITQFYKPFARAGTVTLSQLDGISREEAERGQDGTVVVGIERVQMEQDTAKTMTEPGNIHLLDFNRVGVPLIEIITTPCIHTPLTAAIYVKKVQSLLQAADACVVGMEHGGLRADVNVSVRRTRDHPDWVEEEPLGTRTEIKNLNSLKAIQQAIIAERDRQIAVLDIGEKVVGETRGWTIGQTNTRRLRGKEGEVDYRYMPDADIPPVIISQDLISHLRETLGVTLDEEFKILTEDYRLLGKHAMSLVGLNERCRVEYFYRVVDRLVVKDGLDEKSGRLIWGPRAGSWILNDIGGIITDLPDLLQTDSPVPHAAEGAQVQHKIDLNNGNPLQFDLDGNSIIPAHSLADIIYNAFYKVITPYSGKTLLATMLKEYDAGLESTSKDLLAEMLEERSMGYLPQFTTDDLKKLFLDCVEGNERLLMNEKKGLDQKAMFFVGQIVSKAGKGVLDAKEVAEVVRGSIKEVVDGLRAKRDEVKREMEEGSGR